MHPDLAIILYHFANFKESVQGTLILQHTLNRSLLTCGPCYRAAMASVEYNLRDVNCQGKLRLHCTYMYLRAVPIRAHSQNLHWVDGCVLLKNRKVPISTFMHSYHLGINSCLFLV